MDTLKMMFGGGADVAQLAEMIRRFGRGEDKILAHITPEEAAKLKEMGGSGTVNPMTGLPEFQEDDYLAQARAAEPVGYYGTSQTGFNEATEKEFLNQPMTERNIYDAQLQRNPNNTFENLPTFQYTGSYEPAGEYNFPFTQAGIDATDIGFGPGQYTPAVSRGELTGATQADLEQMYPGAFQEPTLAQRAEQGLTGLKQTLDKYPNLTRLGTAGISTLGQALLARRAGQAREAEAARLRERAAPLRAAEAEAMGRVRGEGLTPQQARQMEIDMAQARQGLSAANRATGSAASGILAGQMQRARSRARQESLQNALDLAQIADRYERAAIQEELAKDADLSRLFAEVMGKEIQAASRTEASKTEAPQRRA